MQALIADVSTTSGANRVRVDFQARLGTVVANALINGRLHELI